MCRPVLSHLDDCPGKCTRREYEDHIGAWPCKTHRILWRNFDPSWNTAKESVYGTYLLKFWLRCFADLVDTVGGAWKLLGYWGSSHSWFRWSTRQFSEEGFRDHETLVSPILFLLELLQPGLLLVRSHPEMKMINAKPAWPMVIDHAIKRSPLKEGGQTWS